MNGRERAHMAIRADAESSDPNELRPVTLGSRPLGAIF